MADDNHGDKAQEEAPAPQNSGQQQAAQEQQEATAAAGADWEKQIAERDARIAELWFSYQIQLQKDYGAKGLCKECEETAKSASKPNQ